MKFAILFVIAMAASAYASAPLGYGLHAPLAVAHAAPLAVAHAPIVHAPIATSYSYATKQIHPAPIVRTFAVAHAPVVAHAAPVVAHAAPLAYGHGLGHLGVGHLGVGHLGVGHLGLGHGLLH